LIAEGHRIPTIFVTAFFDEEVRSHALRAGALGFLSKPFKDQSLIECLNKALQSDGTGLAQRC
jgi:FixJ family two-component response regulator